MDFNYETPDQIPFPDKLVGWFDILKGLGQTALQVVTDRHHFRNVVDMYDQVKVPESQDVG